MKNLHFIVQAKGGVGKSILMYLFALKHYQDSKCLFIDVDASTQTSTRQLKFVHQDQSDIANLLDEKGLLIRDNLLAYLQSIAKEDFKDAYFDFGAPESEQLPALIEYDIPLKAFAEALGFEIRFHIVIGGGGAVYYDDMGAGLSEHIGPSVTGIVGPLSVCNNSSLNLSTQLFFLS